MKTLTSLKWVVIFLVLVLFNAAVYSQNSHKKLSTNALKTSKSGSILVLTKQTPSIGGGDISGSNYVVTS